MPKKSRLHQTLIAIDQVFNALASGWADETLSARAYRMDGTKRRWSVARRVIDGLAAPALLAGVPIGAEPAALAAGLSSRTVIKPSRCFAWIYPAR